MAILPLLAIPTENQECVILLHGLCRTSRSMAPLEKALSAAGYRVVNVDYPSRTAAIEKLGDAAIGQVVADCQKDDAVKIHFVTHSLGGILVRSYLSRHTIPNLGRVVMLGPPNQGSEVVDKLGSWWIFKKINGPAGSELGTGNNSTPNRIGPANFCVGVIAGDRSINWINSVLIPGSDDGKVSVKQTKLEGMADHMLFMPPTLFSCATGPPSSRLLIFYASADLIESPRIWPVELFSAARKSPSANRK